jgi:DNA-binding MarR family transcriptional regulator
MAVTTRAFFYVQQVEQLVRQRIDEALAPHGLTAGQYMVLSMVAHHEPTSSAELARLARMTAPSMGEHVKALEQKGCLERSDDPANRRVLLVGSTKLGRALLAKCEAAVDEAEREFFSCLKAQEVADLRYSLSRVRNAARNRKNEA